MLRPERRRAHAERQVNEAVALPGVGGERLVGSANPEHGRVGVRIARQASLDALGQTKDGGLLGAPLNLAEQVLAHTPAQLDPRFVEGLWLIGLEASPEALPYDQVDFSGPLGLVVGSEGEGLRRLVRETCDLLLRLPMRGRVSSLNVAVAGSIVLYEALRQRRPAGGTPQPTE